MQTYVEEDETLKSRQVTMVMTDESPDISKVVLFLTHHGRGFVQLTLRAGHPLTFPLPWKDGDRWATGLVREALKAPEEYEADGLHIPRKKKG